MANIDYTKYANMSRKQLLHSLTNAEKKSENIELMKKNNNDLIAFLKHKIKESLDKPKYEFEKFTESEPYKLAKEYEKTLSPKELKKLHQEVVELVNKDYGNEL